MRLTPEDAELFFKLHRSLMCFVNERLGIVPDIGSPDDFSALSPETRLKVRSAFLDQPDLIELFVEANPYELSEEELDIVRSWRHQVAGKFFVFRYLKNHAVFLHTEEPPVAYGVLALTQPFEELIGPYLPVWTEAVLLPFHDKIIYDGLLSSHNISFGPGIRRMLNDSYNAAQKRLGVITSLSVPALPAVITKPTKKAQRKTARASSEETPEVVQVVAGMVDDFCREHLDEEYAVLCRKLVEKLARKRPSPLLSGRPNTWACGIVRTIGWVNFLDDRTQTPSMKLTAIDKAFGVGESTGQGKSQAIRTLLKIHQFDHQWMLPSRMDDNPMIWVVEVNGFPMDIRRCPREAQEIAFEKGLIPYIPADRD